MIYKGKEYDENGILELLNNKDNDILTYKEKLDGAETKIKAFENDIVTKDNTINELKIKNYDLLTKVTVGVPEEETKQEHVKIISINDNLSAKKSWSFAPLLKSL